MMAMPWSAELKIRLDTEYYFFRRIEEKMSGRFYPIILNNEPKFQTRQCLENTMRLKGQSGAHGGQIL